MKFAHPLHWNEEAIEPSKRLTRTQNHRLYVLLFIQLLRLRRRRRRRRYFNLNIVR